MLSIDCHANSCQNEDEQSASKRFRAFDQGTILLMTALSATYSKYSAVHSSAQTVVTSCPSVLDSLSVQTVAVTAVNQRFWPAGTWLGKTYCLEGLADRVQKGGCKVCRGSDIPKQQIVHVPPSGSSNAAASRAAENLGPTYGPLGALPSCYAGCDAAALRQDSMSEDYATGKQNLYLQYFFLPSSVGKMGHTGSMPGRREMGHGRLAQIGVQRLMRYAQSPLLCNCSIGPKSQFDYGNTIYRRFSVKNCALVVMSCICRGKAKALLSSSLLRRNSNFSL